MCDCTDSNPDAQEKVAVNIPTLDQPVRVSFPSQHCHCHRKALGSYVTLKGWRDLPELLLCTPFEARVGYIMSLSSRTFKVACKFVQL